ncbi:SYVC-like protein [Mya arenaria]|uniref:valine--tRNA ligase n=1 Tax=Mya arenaria TaxID=6604 RepID=A0ABY7G7C2_MYAAR|nr:SYVC-like protein [Mya arenaria]
MAASWSVMRILYFRHGLKAYKCSRNQNVISTVSPLSYFSTSSTCLKQNKKYEVFQYTVPTKPGEKKDVSVDLPSAYSPQFVEAAWYEWWVEQGFFKPRKTEKSDEKFVLCLPPPNVTGTLHLGHALTCAVQDAIVRWNRMRGLETVWVPGCDHAGIATQVVVEKQLWKESKQTRHDIGREAFLEKVWQWKGSKGDTIYNQMKKMGASLDWSKECFTMDESMCKAVREAFIRLHDEGLIYRSGRLVNWSCHLRSAISDIEVVNEQVEKPTKLKLPGYEKPVTFGEITSFAYPVMGSEEEIVVATTRLETMLGDTAVAVHPEDPRYSDLQGAFVEHPFDGRHIPVITDESVEMNFGTGAVKITPAHDHNDYSMGTRHNLLFINIINDNGEMENVPEQFNGMKRFEAREKVAQMLQEKGLFRGKQPHSLVLPICQRSGDIIEPRIKEQWYIDCAQMTADALQVVDDGSLTLYPEFHNKVWHEFMTSEKSKDWCISRQIWWGHRIPAFKVVLNNKEENSQDMWISAQSHKEAVLKAKEKLSLRDTEFSLVQDEDVLDTWFSSALFPFSVFGWPENTVDLSSYYPNSLLETGNDILFFWVARMVMLGQKLTGQLPFSKVLLHGTLRDSKGRKMSKSLGNVIDPMDVIFGISLKDLQKQVDTLGFDPVEMETAKKGQHKDFPDGIQECGTDALRFGLCSYQFKDPEIRMNIDHVQNYRQFCNKDASKIKEQLHKLELNRLATLKKIEILEKKRRKSQPDMENKIDQLYNKVKSIDGQITDIQSLSI